MIEKFADVARTAEKTNTINRLQLPALFFRTTYRNPITNTYVPLPRHNWVIMQVMGTGSGAARSGGVSNHEGVSSLFPHRVDHGAENSWEFLWQARLPLGGVYPHSLGGSVWVDLDTNDWVMPNDVGGLKRLLHEAADVPRAIGEVS